MIARNILQGALALATRRSPRSRLSPRIRRRGLTGRRLFCAFTTLAVRSDKGDTLSGGLVPTPGSFMITRVEMTLATSLRADMV